MNLNKTPAYQKLQPGDPYTFLFDAPQTIDGKELEVGDTISRWFSTAEPGRIFQITAVHFAAYETRYVGFQEFGR